MPTRALACARAQFGAPLITVTVITVTVHLIELRSYSDSGTSVKCTVTVIPRNPHADEGLGVRQGAVRRAFGAIGQHDDLLGITGITVDYGITVTVHLIELRSYSDSGTPVKCTVTVISQLNALSP